MEEVVLYFYNNNLIFFDETFGYCYFKEIKFRHSTNVFQCCGSYLFIILLFRSTFQIQSRTGRSGFKKRAKFVTVLDVQ